MRIVVFLLLIAFIENPGLTQPAKEEIKKPLRKDRATKTNGPCTGEMAMNHKGRWAQDMHLFFENKLGSQTEMIKRLDEIHKMAFALYPEPVGIDLAWHHTIRNTTFGGKVKTDTTRDGVVRYFTTQGIPIANNYYTIRIYCYICSDLTKNEIVGGFPGAASADLQVMINSLDHFAEIADATCMRINGQPVGMRIPVQGTWKGYELAYNPLSSDTRSILIHRKGMLPYIPVTRKQYLDHSIEHLNEIMNDAIKLQMDIPVRSLEEQEEEKKKKLEKFEKDFGKDPKRLKSAVDYYLAGYKTEQEERDERVKKLTRTFEIILKEYNDELENSRKSGMLETAAFVMDWHTPQPGGQIFLDENKGGKMLIIENPAYLRKDLPKYAPQFMTLYWSTHNDYPPEAKFAEIIKANFPVEKLAAMIDR